MICFLSDVWGEAIQVEEVKYALDCLSIKEVWDSCPDGV